MGIHGWDLVGGGGGRERGDISFTLKNISSIQYLLHHFMDLHNWAYGLG